MAGLLERFGRNLARLRTQAGKTQEQLEHEGAAHRTYVSELERGEKDPSLSKIVALAKALGVSAASLVDFECDSSSEPEGALAVLLQNAALNIAKLRGIEIPAISACDVLSLVEAKLESASVSVSDLLTEATRLSVKREPREYRESLRFLIADRRSEKALRYTDIKSKHVAHLDVQAVFSAVIEANRVLELLHDMALTNGVPIFKLLGLRNLSSFVGEVFKSELCRVSGKSFASNPNQDGYPDLCALTPDGIDYFATRAKNGEMSSKSFWSPFPHGGVEIKATCGNTPPARVRSKPDIGESRWPILTSAEWKAHHRKTNNLIGIYWDFIDGLPTVLAVFYRNDLTVSDWGEVIKPQSDDSATTSVSIMPRGRLGEEVGVKKMARGWIVLPADSRLREALTAKDVFHLTTQDIRSATSATIE